MDNQENNIKNLIDNLNERTKELNCIYRVDEILRDSSADLETVFNEVTGIIPEAYRHSDICKARIVYNEQVYAIESFKKSTLKQTAPIKVEDSIVGEIQVYYIKPITNEKGIFLAEEMKLLNTLASKINDFLLLKRLKETVQEKHSKPQPGDKGEHNSFNDWLIQKGLSNKEIEIIRRIKIDFRKGETICKQGAISSYIMVHADGYAKAYLEGYQEKSLNFKIIKPYDFIGLSSLSGTDCYRHSTSAITPCSLYLVDKQMFTKILDNNSSFNNYIRNWYCDFAGSLFSRLHCVANKQALGRIADVLQYLSDEIFVSPVIPSSISRKDIAELAGMSTESAVRILSELKNDSIIRTKKNEIELLKPDIIKTIALAG